MLSIGTIAAKVFGSSNDRRVKGYKPKVEAINALEPEMERLSDAELRARTDEFRRQLADGVSARRSASFRPSPPCARAPSAASASAISTCS